MKSQISWTIVVLLASAALLISCGSVDAEKDLLVGTWELSNIESMIGQDEMDFSEYEESIELGITLTFNSDSSFSMDLTMNMDIENIVQSMMGSELVEIEAETVKVEASFGGTYEIETVGVVLLMFDEGSFEMTPEEFCFSVAGMETCQSVGEMVGDITDFVIYDDDDGAYYEIDENKLTLWDNECDYPTEQTCAAAFSKSR